MHVLPRGACVLYSALEKIKCSLSPGTLELNFSVIIGHQSKGANIYLY